MWPGFDGKWLIFWVSWSAYHSVYSPFVERALDGTPGLVTAASVQEPSAASGLGSWCLEPLLVTKADLALSVEVLFVYMWYEVKVTPSK